MADDRKRTEGPAGTSENAQAHFVKAAKSPCTLRRDGAGTEYETRRWSLFFFFRILTNAEMRATMARVDEVMKSEADEPGSHGPESTDLSPLETLKLDLAYPSALNAGLVKQEAKGRRMEAEQRGDGQPAPAGEDADPLLDDPAKAFLDWLKLLIDADIGPLMKGMTALNSRRVRAANPATAGAMADKLLASLRAGNLNDTLHALRDLDLILPVLARDYLRHLDDLRESLHTIDEGSSIGPLLRVILYEFLRQNAPAFASAEEGGTGKDKLPIVRSEKAEAERGKKPERFDRTPISFAFTFPGLRALRIDKDTLASFPDAFKEGMAARAGRLGDVGRSAPENWEGEFGLGSLHGFFTGGSNLEATVGAERGKKRRLKEPFWRTMRAEIRAFNDPAREKGSDLRTWIGLLFRLVGLEIVHIELGQDPYDVNEDGSIESLELRKEHFGFRDGLSQPFVDLDLGDPLPGGGTAARRGTWTPVASGEIFLDQRDETGQPHAFPFNETLRRGSTYLVFRKLEQDVPGFRAFIGQQRPRDEWAQRTLAAQLVGRWPNGMPLALSPKMQRNVGGDVEATLNDFRYGDDPYGRKCPLGAHIRRANPRDIGGRNDVRHHRILRRGIAYGGPLLHHKQPDDSEKRGLLFICANARIDLQFEVIQADWLNGGEFLGQAGLGRCPLMGANDGSVRAAFLESDATAPVRGLPSFVTMRGGDYFFAPGIDALRGIAKGDKFVIPDGELPFLGHSMGNADTPALLGDARLKLYEKRMLEQKDPPICLRVPPGRAGGTPERIVFVADYGQVTGVLSNGPHDPDDPVTVAFSVAPYRTAGRRIARGEDFLVGTEKWGETARTRERLARILDLGWATLTGKLASEGRTLTEEIRKTAAARLDMSLRRTAGARRIDLVDDLATQAAYGVVDEIFGVPGPTWLSEMAAALPFARQHVADLPPDWIARFKGERPSDLGLTTMQVWTAALVADLIANNQALLSLHALGKQAGAEMLSYLDLKLFQAASETEPAPFTLVKAFLANIVHPEFGPEIAKFYGPDVNDQILQMRYSRDVAIILLEIVGAALAIIPHTFASVMNQLLRQRTDLTLLLPRFTSLTPDEKSEAVRRIIYEAERLNPNAAVRMRRCEADTMLGGQQLEAGDVVAAMIGAANRDEATFKCAERFLLGRFDPQAGKNGPARNLDNYLLFGVEGSHKICWGRNHVAMPVLEECIYACGRLQGLRRVAGPGGVPQKMLGVAVSLPARFTRILPKQPPPP